MNNITKRRVVLSTTLAALAAGPFVIRSYRKRKKVVLRWSLPSELSSTGYFTMAEASFTPLKLPHSKEIHYHSITACLSTDKKLLLASYSYGEDWKSRLCCAPVSEKSVVGNFGTLLDIEKSRSIITGLGCSGIDNGKVSFHLRRCEPDDDPESFCKAMLCFAFLERSLQDVFAIPKEYISVDDYSWLDRSTYVRGFHFFHDAVAPHIWLSGSDSIFYGGDSGIHKFSPQSKERPALFKQKIVYHFGKPGSATENTICGTPYDNGNQTFSFVTAPRSCVQNPYTEKEVEYYNKRWGNLELGAFTVEGTRSVIDAEGNLMSQSPFPAVPKHCQSKFTQTHWCFGNHRGYSVFYAAPLDDPKNYTVFVLPSDQMTEPVLGLPLIYTIHTVLSDGQSLLCSRNIGARFISEAKKGGIVLSELGIVKLPFSIG